MEETRLTVLYSESRASRNEIIDGFWEIFGALPNIEVIDSESQGVVTFKIYGRYLMTSLNAFNLILNRLNSNAALRINGRPC